MKLFKKIFPTKEKSYTLLTGGHLDMTKDILKKLSTKYPKRNYLILYKDYEASINKYDEIPNTQVFDFNIDYKDSIEELLFFLKESKVTIYHK
jgi:hypothetical protein